MAREPIYHKLYISPLSKRPRAFTNRREKYVWQYTPEPVFESCEIVYIQEGSLLEASPDGDKIYRQGTVHTILQNRYFRESCPDPVFHEYTLRFFVYTPYEPMTVEEVARWTRESYVAILPEHIDNPVACERLSKLLKNAVKIYKENAISRTLMLQGILCECLGILTEYAVLQAQQYLQQKESRRSPITDRACEYIRRHLADKCTMEDLAAAIGVTYNYLFRVFRRDMGMTLVEYWNRCRIHKVEELITVGGMSMPQAGDAVGIEDVKYLSRLFRRYTGVTSQEFRHIYHGRSSSGMNMQE